MCRFGRGNFQETCQVPTKLQPYDKSVNWDSLRFIIFDNPPSYDSVSKNNLNFESRFHSLLENVSEDNPFLVS